MTIAECNSFMSDGWTIDEIVEEEEKKSMAMKKAAALGPIFFQSRVAEVQWLGVGRYLHGPGLGG